MARRRSGSRQTATRDANAISNDALSSLLSPAPALSPLLEVEDARAWHPDPEQGALTIGGRFARVVVHKRPIIARSKPIWAWRGLPVGPQVPVGLRFESPLKVVTCLRRKIRREVIFALNRGGKGGGKKAKPRRTWRSGIRC